MQNFKKLRIWEDGMSLTLEAYDLTKRFPRSEDFALSSQIRRAAYSIPTNIAEGCGRNSDADFARFLQYAIGSSYELETELILAHKLGYITEDEFNHILDHLAKLGQQINNFKNKVVRGSDQRSR